jgi:hypothetical protein
MPVKQGLRLICSLEFDEETRFFSLKENPKKIHEDCPIRTLTLEDRRKSETKAKRATP